MSPYQNCKIAKLQPSYTLGDMLASQQNIFSKKNLRFQSTTLRVYNLQSACQHTSPHYKNEFKMSLKWNRNRYNYSTTGTVLPFPAHRFTYKRRRSVCRAPTRTGFRFKHVPSFTFSSRIIRTLTLTGSKPK